jgi:polyhydroxyalkanoate synthesis regulator phasin
LYKKDIPYKDINGKPRNETVHLHLFEREVFKLLVEFNAILQWRDKLKNQSYRDLETHEVVEFYNNLEKILLEAWGIPSPDGSGFKKAGKWEFEESALFNATMMMFVTDPAEANKMIDALLPSGLQEFAEKAESNLNTVAEAGTPEQQEEIARLRRQLAEAQTKQSDEV